MVGAIREVERDNLIVAYLKALAEVGKKAGSKQK